MSRLWGVELVLVIGEMNGETIARLNEGVKAVESVSLIAAPQNVTALRQHLMQVAV